MCIFFFTYFLEEEKTRGEERERRHTGKKVRERNAVFCDGVR